MIYLLKKSIERSSCIAALTVIKYASSNKLHGLMTRPGEKEELDFFIKSGKISELTENGKNKIRQFIGKKLDICEDSLDRIMSRDAARYSMEEIEIERKCNQFTVLELGGAIGMNQNTYYHFYKKNLPMGLDEITMHLIRIAGEKKKRKQPGINLMRTRVNEGYTLETASEYLHISPRTLWNYDWYNSVPIDLIEKVAILYRVDQEIVPISFKEEMNYRNILPLIRKNNGIKIREISEKTGYSKGRCSAFENSDSTVPPYEYMEALLENTGLTPESVLLNAMKSDIKYVSIPLETIEYYRKVYYHNEEKDWNKKNKTPKGRKEFQQEVGINPSEYSKGIWTVKQAKKAISVLNLEIKYTDLIMPLTEEQKKIMTAKIDIEKLKNGRLKKKLSIAMASCITGVGYSTIAAIECGKYTCTPKILKRLADCYDLDIEYFV
ncbi:MAG: transcriptional regulator [Firmicutes bacterium]|nr:transcriptional regulator [Bacillota bacterium]